LEYLLRCPSKALTLSIAGYEKPADNRVQAGHSGRLTPRPLQAMPGEQLTAFLEVVKADAGLQEKLKGAKDLDAVVEIAKAAGFVFSVELVEALKGAQTDLSDEELESVTGGVTSALAVVGNSLLFCEAGALVAWGAWKLVDGGMAGMYGE
jgi:predicted ribosomally synthesized peptide with nif11-like leader